MCRFAVYLGPTLQLSELVTDPSNSIIHQSYDAKERAEPLNGDGFGVAWYVPELREAPALFKDVSPAWNNMNLLHLAPVTRSRCLLAHVRAATPGLAVTQLNCHPFVRGRVAFMHNGSIGGFRRIYRQLREGLSDRAYAAIEGTTDSEHVLAVFSDIYAEGGGSGLEAMASAVEATVARIEQLRVDAGVDEPSLLNLVFTDGENLVATRYVSPGATPAHSLYQARGALVVEGGEGQVVHHGQDEPAVVVASEPLGPRHRWELVAQNHMVLVNAAHDVELRPMSC